MFHHVTMRFLLVCEALRLILPRLSFNLTNMIKFYNERVQDPGSFERISPRHSGLAATDKLSWLVME